MENPTLLNAIEMAIYLRVSYSYFLDMILTEWSDMPVYDYDKHLFLFHRGFVMDYLDKKYNKNIDLV